MEREREVVSSTVPPERVQEQPATLVQARAERAKTFAAASLATSTKCQAVSLAFMMRTARSCQRNDALMCISV